MTREEIVNSLRCCVTFDGAGCAKCNDKELRDGLLNCSDTLKSVAADLIENQQREIEALRKANEGLRFNLAAYVGGGIPDAPRWCEDCRYFESLDPTGEGECKASKPKADVWYGRVACENFQRKEVSP